MNYAFANNYDMSPYYFSAFEKLSTIEFGGRPLKFSNAHIPVSMTQIKAYQVFATLPDFSNATRLRKLDLCFNTFVSIPNEYISGLNSLGELNFCHGKLEVMPDVSHLKRLVKLWFYSNSLSTIPRSSIEGLKHIQHFRFQHNKITIMSNISYLSSLRTVELNNNLIAYIPNGVLDGIPYLQKLGPVSI